MDRWLAMRVFVSVAETGGFAEAGRKLNMSPPAVTRAIAGLEEVIGTRLFTRTTRSVRLTEAGSRYVEDCRRILTDISEAEASAAGLHATPTGTLVITAPVLFGHMYVMPIITDFLDQYPAMTLRALFLDRITNIVDEGIDVAVRIGHLGDSSLNAVRVGTVRRVVCGSPDYFKAHGMPKIPSDLAHHNIIANTGAWTSLDWRFGRDQKLSVTVHPRFFCNTNEAAIGAATSGWGLTRQLSYQIGPALRDGKLQTILTDFEENPLPIHLIHAGGHHASAKVKSFIDFTAKCLRANRLIN